MENHHAINGQINYFDWAIFNSKLLVIARGYLNQHWLVVLTILKNMSSSVGKDYPIYDGKIIHSCSKAPISNSSGNGLKSTLYGFYGHGQ